MGDDAATHLTDPQRAGDVGVVVRTRAEACQVVPTGADSTVFTTSLSATLRVLVVRSRA